jgi:transposase
MSEASIIGIDVDSAWLVVATYGSAGTRQIANQATAIREWLTELPLHSRIGLESTSHYHALTVKLAQAAGHTVFVLNPRDVRYYALGVGRRGKTDRVDAQVIARYVAKEGEHLHAYLPRTPAQQQMHALQQQRAAVTRSQAMLQQALGAHGAISDTFRPMLQAMRTTLREVDRQIQALSRQGPQAALYRRLMTIPGVGPVIAACVAHHLTRWPLAGADAWVAYTGLDPRANDSGRKTGVRRLSKRGEPTLRQMLYMAAMTFARNPLGRSLNQAHRQRGLSSTATYNILARKLARIAWGLHKSEQDFDPVRLAADHHIALAA